MGNPNFYGDYRMPSEFEAHEGTWLLWPVRHDNWRDQAREAQMRIAELASIISSFEHVFVGVAPEHLASARRFLPSTCTLVELQYDDIWIRDTGPIYVLDKQRNRVGLDFEFNSWGGLFDSWNFDNSVPAQILARDSMPRIDVPLVLEGGSISVNGNGLLITTEECLLSTSRNAATKKSVFEELFYQYLGVTRVIWLPKGLAHDETGGHVDNVAVFTSETTVALSWTEEKSSPQFARCLAAFDELSSISNTIDKLEIIKVPLPPPLVMSERDAARYSPSHGSISRKAGDIFCASYVNMYFVNGGIIIPKFGIEQDDDAYTVIKNMAPNRQVVQIDAREFVFGGGGPHCVTQQVPSGK